MNGPRPARPPEASSTAEDAWAPEPGPAESTTFGGGAWILPASLLAVVAISALDWLTPAGIVVGILLSVPILVSSISDRPSDVWIVTAAALIGKTLAAIHGVGPLSPPTVWITNRVFAVIAVLASGFLAWLLQARRSRLREARDDALASRDLNRLLLTLLAHDLRAPLNLADQALQMAERHVRGEAEADPELLFEVRSRLQRNLRVLDGVLQAIESRLGGAAAADFGSHSAPASAVESVREEVRSFHREAWVAGKSIELDLGSSPPEAPVVVEGAVLRQALSIVLDNAIRYADPGPIRVRMTRAVGYVQVEVSDPGPGFVPRTSDDGPGEPLRSGLGLRLCRLLVARADGRLEVRSAGPDGTTVRLELPILALDLPDGS